MRLTMVLLSGESSSSPKRELNKGAWTFEEDQTLAEAIQVHGPGRWKSIVAKAGLNRCAKSCRLRWVNYLRPNIKRGSMSADEEDLIIRLHKLLGNRWSLIAGRLPGRTDNDVKNYWNSRLKKKIMKQKELQNTNGSKDVVLQEESVGPQTGSVVEMNFTVLKEGEADNSRRSDDPEVPKAREEGNKDGVFDCYFNDDEAWNSSGWMSQFLLKMDEGCSETSQDHCC